MNESAQQATVTDLTPFLQPGRKEFRAIFEHAAAGMATATCSGQLLQVNPAFCEFLGYSGAELATLSVFDITHPADLQQTLEIFLDANSGPTSRAHHYQKRYVRKDGSHVWALTSVVWVRDQKDRATYCVALIQDINQVKAADEELKSREEIYRTLVENLDFGIALVDENHRIIMVNSARARLFGRHADSFPHKQCFRAFDKGAGICQSCPGARALRTGRPESHTSELELPDGRRLITRIQAFPVFNAEGRADRFIEVCEDTTQQLEVEQRLRENQQQLEFLANYDPVTRLPNRFLLFERLTRMIGKTAPEEPQALLLVGLNRFKRINEALGYEIGDLALAEVGQRLQGCVRGSDTVARTGSCEFAVVLEGVGEIHSVVTIAEKILRACGQPFHIEGQELYMAASLGISRYPEDGDNPGRLLKAAEVALAKCKTELDGGYRFYTSDLDARSRELLELESCLARAIDQGELLLHYQPQIDLDSGRLIGVEALLRWDRPGHGLVSPGDFIPLAEASGLIHPMGDWALREACEQAVAWRDQGLPPVLMAANISPRQFQQPGLAERVRTILQETGMDPRFLEIEITESTIMHDIDQAVRTMQEINSLDVRLAIDDFGTGYSSLGALKRFPIQKLKIDQTFVRDLTSNSNDAAITDAVIALARAMSLEVIAEGIETEQQLAFLRDRQCDQGQGYLFSRPVPAEACRQLMAEPGQPLYPPRQA